MDMKNPMLAEAFNQDIIEELNDNAVVGGLARWLQLSPLSNALGNKGAFCTETVECQNNCR